MGSLKNKLSKLNLGIIYIIKLINLGLNELKTFQKGWPKERDYLKTGGYMPSVNYAEKSDLLRVGKKYI